METSLWNNWMDVTPGKTLMGRKPILRYTTTQDTLNRSKSVLENRKTTQMQTTVDVFEE